MGIDVSYDGGQQQGGSTGGNMVGGNGADITRKSDWQSPPGDTNGLLGWLMPKIKDWRQYRDDNYRALWDEYYRLWRGIWSPNDKGRASERSRLISPALQQAVEGAVSEIQEAIFGRDRWFDLMDDPNDPDPTDMEKYRVQLKDDLERENVKYAICEAILNGALYGSGVGEIITEEKTELSPEDQAIPGTGIRTRGVRKKKYLCVRLNPVSPYNFSSDPGIAAVEECLGCEVTELIAEHVIIAGIKSGAYWDVDYGSYTQDSKFFTLPGEPRRIPTDDKVKLTKYYGKVPRELLAEARGEDTEGESENKAEGGDEGEDLEDLVEAIVVIANDQAILKATKNPYMMQDRPIIAYQHDMVPGRFWGRGVCEKGYNPQKALDTELRARADNLALTTHPMMGVDASRLPRGVKPEVMPGKTILTTGDPNNILRPLTFGNLNPVSFKESAELERMVTMGTGTMDSAAPLGVDPRNATLGGMSLMQAASIKRQKRTLENFNDTFLAPFIQKSLWRFMQFDPKRYPVKDFQFQATSSLGIMARELEIQNLVTLLGYVADTPAAPILIKAIVNYSSFPNREDLMKQLDQAQQQSKQPSPEQQAVQAQVQIAQQQNQITAQKNQADAQNNQEEIALRKQELALQWRQLDMQEKQATGDLALRELDIHRKSQLGWGDIAAKARGDHIDRVLSAHGDHADRVVDLVDIAAKAKASENKPKPEAKK